MERGREYSTSPRVPVPVRNEELWAGFKQRFSLNKNQQSTTDISYSRLDSLKDGFIVVSINHEAGDDFTLY